MKTLAFVCLFVCLSACATAPTIECAICGRAARVVHISSDVEKTGRYVPCAPGTVGMTNTATGECWAEEVRRFAYVIGVCRRLHMTGVVPGDGVIRRR